MFVLGMAVQAQKPGADIVGLFAAGSNSLGNWFRVILMTSPLTGGE